ncbi:MAG: hypothetical protein IPO63_14980 [Bacteroidetes bacterium]|nr:hypothetical protein [Bacteroidota bacterium]
MLVENVIPEADTLEFDVSQISFEKSGFKINTFSAHASIQPGQMAFSDLKSKTDKSTLKGAVVFDFNDMDDFQNFIADVRWKGDFEKSTVDFFDLSFFAKELAYINSRQNFRRNFSGTVDRFKGKNVVLNYGKILFKGKVSMTRSARFF